MHVEDAEPMTLEEKLGPILGLEEAKKHAAALQRIFENVARQHASIPMLLWCPECGTRHIDAGEFATRVHATHACQSCGHVWRPAVVATVGVRFLPGFKDKDDPTIFDAIEAANKKLRDRSAP